MRTTPARDNLAVMMAGLRIYYRNIQDKQLMELWPMISVYLISQDGHSRLRWNQMASLWTGKVKVLIIRQRLSFGER